MAHKSKGYIYTTDAVPSLIRNGALTFFNRLEHHSEQAATLVMHESSTHERVFTESEVKALAKRILEQAMVIPGDDSHYPFQAVETEDVVKAFAGAGVVIDPA
jgi:hypothetical protein